MATLVPTLRCWHAAQMLAETAAAVGFEETVKSIVPLLRPLAEVSFRKLSDVGCHNVRRGGIMHNSASAQARRCELLAAVSTTTIHSSRVCNILRFAYGIV